MRKRCRPTHQYCQRGVWSKCSEPKLSSNPHTASKHTIHEDFEVDETSSEVNDEEGGEPSCGCSDGSDGTHTPCEGRIAARCSQDRTTIESEPPMIRRRVPAAASRQHVVGGKTLVLALSLKRPARAPMTLISIEAILSPVTWTTPLPAKSKNAMSLWAPFASHASLDQHQWTAIGYTTAESMTADRRHPWNKYRSAPAPDTIVQVALAKVHWKKKPAQSVVATFSPSSSKLVVPKKPPKAPCFPKANGNLKHNQATRKSITFLTRIASAFACSARRIRPQVS